MAQTHEIFTHIQVEYREQLNGNSSTSYYHSYYIMFDWKSPLTGKEYIEGGHNYVAREETAVKLLERVKKYEDVVEIKKYVAERIYLQLMEELKGMDVKTPEEQARELLNKIGSNHTEVTAIVNIDEKTWNFK